MYIVYRHMYNLGKDQAIPKYKSNIRVNSLHLCMYVCSNISPTCSLHMRYMLVHYIIVSLHS